MIGRILNGIMLIILGMTAGSAVSVKYYDLQGLWGVRNAALHTERVVLPALTKTAVEASKACETNAGVAKDNEADPGDLRRCPAAPKVAITAKKP